MEWIRVLLSHLAAVVRWRRLDADLDDELRTHIELAVAENIRSGMTAEQARTKALRAFGGMTQVRESYRMQRGLPGIGQFGRDVHFAIRQLRKSPGYSLTAILTLALGIGGVTTVFSVVNAVLLKPFSFRDPDRLVIIREVEKEALRTAPSIPVNYRHYLRLKHDAKTLEDAAIFQEPGFSVSPSGDRPQIVGGITASPNFLRVLGVQPILGRDFAESDAVKGAPPVVLLTYDAWRVFFQRDAKVIGRSLRLDGDRATVIGVLPPGVRFPKIELAPIIAGGPPLEKLIIRPLIPDPYFLKTDEGGFNFSVIARLKPNVSVEEAASELETLQRAYSASAHLPIHLGIAVTPLAKDVTSGISGALWLLLSAVGAVLLIACVNLANLQLARAVAAERETAVRAALGASKGRLVFARLAESLVLALSGGVAGVTLAFGGLRLLLALVPANVPRLNEVQVDLPVLLFATGLSIAAALLFGTLPALRSLRVHPQAALQSNSSRSVNSQEGRRTRNILVASQVACTVALLIVTSLILRSFSRLMQQDRGFDATHVTLAEVALFAPRYGDSKPNIAAVKLAFADRAMTGFGQLPGVQSVAITSAIPLSGETWVDDLTRPDHTVPPAQRPLINVRWINPEYLSTMQIPLMKGRNFAASDRANPYVALISERTAREGFPGENPIGRQMSNIVPDSQKSVTVIGIVPDTRINGLKDTADMVYLPYWAYTPWQITFLVRSSQPSSDLIPEMRRVVWSIDPQVAIPALKSMDAQLDESVSTERFQTIVLASFGTAALLLALLGVYGVQAYSVSLRRQEFGIRIALGSGRATLIRLALWQAAVPVLLGACTGLALAGFALRFIRSLLYQTPVLDPVAIGVSLLVLLCAAALAAIVPARRAASIDPMRALRIE